MLLGACLLETGQCKIYQIQKKMQQAITKATITLSRVFLSPIFRNNSLTPGSRVKTEAILERLDSKRFL